MPGLRCAPAKPSAVDLLTATAGHLRQLLDSSKTTSVELVQLYIDQIARHNHAGLKLHAINAVAPFNALLEKAKALDDERGKIGLRSPLHGIPITLKDFYLAPSFGLETTCGSFALKGLTASEDAAIAIALEEAGCIVIALANLSEWANCKGSNLTSGWSPIGGQTQTPYVKGGVCHEDQWLGHSTPGGSSSGSAVGTAAGFSAFSIGSEADGSIVQPAIRAALYSIKGTVGDVNMRGSMSGGAGFDSAGPLAKSVEDCADAMDVLLPGRDFRSHLVKSWRGLRVAYLDYKTWQFADWICHATPAFDEEHETAMINAMKTIENSGGKVSYDAPLMMPEAIAKEFDTADIGNLLTHDLAFTYPRFLALFGKPELRTVQDLVKFNNDHAELELPPDQPSQSALVNAANDTMSHEKYAHDLEYLRKSYRDAIERCFNATQADVIMASGESYLTSIASGSGYPIASVPLGFSSYNGRPFGMEIMARNGEEEKIFKVMSAWQESFPEARKPPPQLVNWGSAAQNEL